MYNTVNTLRYPMAKKKYYVVFKGYKPGIYNFWNDVEKQIKGFMGAQYKNFKTKADAEVAFNSLLSDSEIKAGIPNGSYMTVDAAFSAHTTEISEWRGVMVDNCIETEVFRSRAFKGGSGNVGEFLAVIQAMKYLSIKNLTMPIYSDSNVALTWIEKKSHNSKSFTSPALTILLDKANKYLKSDEYEKVKNDYHLNKWNTKIWGEIPADFGRKRGNGLAMADGPVL